jgi:hypothetical protein
MYLFHSAMILELIKQFISSISFLMLYNFFFNYYIEFFNHYQIFGWDHEAMFALFYYQH